MFLLQKMKKKSIIFFAILWFLAIGLPTFAQQQNAITLLKSSLKQERNENTQVDILLGLSEEYERTNILSEALNYAEQAMEIAEKNSYKKGLTLTYMQLSEVHGKLGNKSDQKKFKKKASKLFGDVNDVLGSELVNQSKQQLLAEEQLKKQKQLAEEQLKKQQILAEEEQRKQQKLADTQLKIKQLEIAQSTQTIDRLSADTTQKRIEILKNQQAITAQSFEIEALNHEKKLQQLAMEKTQLEQRYLMIGLGFVVLLVLLLGKMFLNKQKSNTLLSEKNVIIANEKSRSDSLLLNILPLDLVNELKLNGVAQARHYEQVSVLFTDFKDFTLASNLLSPQALVEEIDFCFRAFDDIIGKYQGIEKIKTIGDAYLCAAGLPTVNTTHATDLTMAALEIRDFMINLKAERAAQNKFCFGIRIGINTGPVVAGVVGSKKFAYDIWGDTVNTASRMETNSEDGKVNISEHTYQLIKSQFLCQYRGKIAAKNKGEIDMYFVEKSN